MVDVDDAYSGENVKMCAMLFYIINDFPTYGNLDGYNVKGHKCVLYVNLIPVFTILSLEKRSFTLGIKNF